MSTITPGLEAFKHEPIWNIFFKVTKIEFSPLNNHMGGGGGGGTA